MWLVFVLHAFCVASFCVLWSLALGPQSSLCMPLGGMVGLGVSLGVISLLYIGLQVFVYLSFSVSFA
jgi:hypothetical protein